MSIKIKLRKDKAIVKFIHPIDKEYFIHIIRQHRDDQQKHPRIILKHEDGRNVPPEEKKHPIQPVTDPEIIKKIQIQGEKK